MDLNAMTLWRIQFLQEILKTLPEQVLEKVPDKTTLDPDVMLGKRSGEAWLDTLLDQVRWYSHLFPGREQCYPDKMEAWDGLYQALYNVGCYIRSHTDLDQKLNKVVDVGLRAMQRNKWVFDFLRPDQLTLVNSSRANSASLGLEYIPTYDATKEHFNQKPNFNFFLNSPVFNDKLGGIEGLSNVNLIGAPTGTGKCLGYGTPVIMANGDTKQVQDILVGDRVMGPDGKGRNVLALGSGRDELYRITPVKGDPYVVNSEHLLSLKITKGSDGLILQDGSHLLTEGPHFIKTETLYKSNKTAKHCLKGWRPEWVDFENETLNLPIPPYILGLWLGDGTSKQPELAGLDGSVVEEWKAYAESIGCKVSKRDDQEGRCPIWRIVNCGRREESGALAKSSFNKELESLGLLGNKHIPKSYLMTTKENRLEILAGLIDTDGHLHSSNGYEISQKNKMISDGIVFICRSLGLAAYQKLQKTGVKTLGFAGEYWRVHISGNCSIIPVRDPRKKAQPRLQKKNHLLTGIRIESVGTGDYYGFVLDGDHQFLLGDWQVTHNTRMSLVSSLGNLCFSNEVIPYAAQRLAVFVRTRSQTQAFLKESKRLGCTVSCPISTTLGCTAHNKQNQRFLENLFSLFERLKNLRAGSLRLDKTVISLPTRIPAELYPSVAKKLDNCVALANATASLMDLASGIPTIEVLFSVWKKMVKENSQDANFKDLSAYLELDLEGELRNANLYLRSDGKCKGCPGNPDFFNKDLEGIEEEKEALGSSQNPRNFFNARMDKDADINKIAEDFQAEFGFCGRSESKKTMATADVVIFTYNWLIDPGIAIHTNRAMKTSPCKGLNPGVAVVCDEAHFLYDFNDETTISFQELFKLVGDLWFAKVHYLDQATFKIPGLENPIAPPKSTDRMDFDQVDKCLKVVMTFLEKFCTLEGNDTPVNMFCLATGHKSAWYPQALYEPFLENFTKEYKEDPIPAVFRALEAMVGHFDNHVLSLTSGVEDLEKGIQDAIEKAESQLPIPQWVEDAIQTWKAGGSRNRVNFQRALIKVSSGTQLALIEAHTYLRDFSAILREVIFSVSQGTFNDRILAVSMGNPRTNNLFGVNIFEGSLKPQEEIDEKKTAGGLSHYLMTLSKIAKAPTREWDTAGINDLLRFYHQGGGFLRGLELRPTYRKEIKASFKVNRPHIQTALRPYTYVNFLTGTPADQSVWKAKSGFRYFTQSEYPNYRPMDYFEMAVDERYELKQATKGEALFRDLSQAIQDYSGVDLTLVCYPSKLTMNEIVNFFPEKYKGSCIIESEMINLDMIQDYAEKNPTGAIHAVISGRFLEGVEFTDQAGSSLVKRAIIVGVPFNPPTEENRQIEAYFVKKFDWDQWEAMNMLMYLPAKFKIRQAIGRTVRNLTDRGKVIFLDKRYGTSKMLRKSLGFFG